MQWLATAASAAVALLAACSSAPPAEQPGERRHGRTSHSGHGLEHADGEPDRDFPAAMSAFHTVMDEHWHDAHGPARNQAVCAGVSEMRDHADAVAKADPPSRLRDEQDSSWRTTASALVASVDRLAQACSGGDVEAAFHDVHEAFHDLVVIWDAA